MHEPVTLSFMRLFAAVPLPPAAVERLLALRLRLSEPRDGLRWSTPEQWHITLQFYGEVSPAQAALLQEGLEQIAVAAPELAIEDLGMFAAKGILFASVVLTPSLLHLREAVVMAGARCGFVPESRPFRPHITLARSRGREGHLSLRRLSSPSLPSLGPKLQWRAEECLLLESTLLPRGSEYAVKSRVRLLQNAVRAKDDPQAMPR